MVQTPSTEQKQRVRKWIQLKAYTNSSLPRQSCIRAAHPCSFVRCFSSALVIPAPHYDSNGMLCEPHPVKRTVKKYKISLVSSRALLAAFYAARQSVCFSIGVSTPRLRWTRLVCNNGCSSQSFERVPAYWWIMYNKLRKLENA